MVRYNGRQKLLTSTLNTNQIGLKMSGTAPSVGTSISARRYTKRRVRDNLKFCGPVYYHGQLWSNNSGDSCVKKAPKNQSLAGGVGRINNPRTKCNIKCSLEVTALPLPDIDNKQDLIDALNKWGNNKNAYQNPSNWDVSKVTDMSNLFGLIDNDLAVNFNENLSSWDVSNVTDMTQMFTGATKILGEYSSFTSLLETPVVADWYKYWIFAWPLPIINNKQDLKDALNKWRYYSHPTGYIQVLAHPNKWDVSKVTDMYRLFHDNNFNEDIGDWDVSNVTNMSQMFYLNLNFNQDISRWNVSKVTDMSAMFAGNNGSGEPNIFNQDISRWNVSSVTNMESMFADNREFNQNIGDWDVSKVTNMYGMFRGTEKFNQNLSNWDVSSVTNTSRMFFGATAIKAQYASGTALPDDPDIANWASYWI